MRFFVIGGSGRTGEAFIDDALAHGHEVVALVRKLTSLAPRTGLRTVLGSPLSGSDVITAMATATEGGATIDAVAVALNARRASDSPFAALAPETSPTMLTDGALNVLAAMQRHGVRKIVFLSMLGAGSSEKGNNMIFRFLFNHSNMRFQIADHTNADTAVRDAAADGNIDFVMVRPCMMTDGEEAPVKILGEEGAHAAFMPKISRKSVARFMVRAAETDEWNGTAQVITN